MKALILAAGIGKRLSPYTDLLPKCLLSLADTTLLDRMLACLAKVGVNKAYIVVGHLKEKIMSRAGKNLHGVDIEYVENPCYEQGSLSSLLAARDILQGDDFLLMDADVLFPLQALEKLVESPHRNCLLMDPGFEDSGEEMKLGIEDGRTREISRRLSRRYPVFGEGVGFVKIDRDSLAELRDVLQGFESGSGNDLDYEEALNVWVGKVHAGHETLQGLPWIEVDFYEDWKRAWTVMLPEIRYMEESRRIKPLNRWISAALTRLLLKTSLTPNQITLASFVSGLLSLAMFALGGYGLTLLGALFLQVSYVLDNCDGEVARARDMRSNLGGWFDIGCDAVLHVCLFPAIAWGLSHGGTRHGVLVLGNIASLGALVTFSFFIAKRLTRSSQAAFLRLVPTTRPWKILAWLKAGDFSLIVLAFALLNAMNVFLWFAAFGLHIFWLAAVVFDLDESAVS